MGAGSSASSARCPPADPQPAAWPERQTEGEEPWPPAGTTRPVQAEPRLLRRSAAVTPRGGRTPFPSAPRAPAAEAGPGRWRRPCRPWLLRAVCCGLRCGGAPACYRCGPPPCGEVSAAAGGGSPAPQPALPAAGRREGERQVAGARRSEGGRQGRAVQCGAAEGGRRAPCPGGSPLRRRCDWAEAGGLPGLARAGRVEQAAVAGTRSGPAVLACPARVLMFPRSSRPGAACPPGPAPRPRAARPGAGSRLPAPPEGRGCP